MGRNVDIAALVAAADTPARDTGRLAKLTHRCWPVASDSTQPAARDWVRRWRPRTVRTLLPECACARGTCLWCN